MMDGGSMVIDPHTFRRLCRAHALLTAVGADGRAQPADAPARTVRDVARQVGISPFHFIRLFAALFGATPHQLRKRIRIERAQQLLAGGQQVTEVCMELGLSSIGSFSSAFKAQVGESPLLYQQRARALVQVPAALARPPEAPGCLSLMAWLPPSVFAISEKPPPPAAC
jgi:AraC-like DNA-binding protein